MLEVRQEKQAIREADKADSRIKVVGGDQRFKLLNECAESIKDLKLPHPFPPPGSGAHG